MFHSFLLAQILGLYLVIMAIIMIARREFYREMAKNLREESGAVIVGGSFGLVIGLIIVVIHNTWVLNPMVFVTIVGWLILIKSIMWLAFTKKMISWNQKTYRGASFFVIPIIMLIIGIILLAFNYHLFRASASIFY